MITKDVPEVLYLYAKWEKIEEVDSSEDSVFKNPETNSTSYILIGILSITILGTVLTIVYRIKNAGEWNDKYKKRDNYNRINVIISDCINRSIICCF